MGSIPLSTVGLDGAWQSPSLTPGPKNGAPGYDVAAIFVKEDQCAMVFSGTSGLADITTDFTLMFSIPATTCHVDCMAFTRAFFNDVQQFMLTLILLQHWARLVYLLNLHESYFGLSLEGLPFFPENS